VTELWSTRASSIDALNTTLRPQADCIEQVFRLLDEAISRLFPLNPAVPVEGRELAAVAAPIAIKGRNLALGIYGFILDGLAQEGGALLRPLLEVIELLSYVQDRTQLVKVMEEGKPSAGRIAKAVNSGFQKLRSTLSQHAAHLGLSDVALGHVIGVADDMPVLTVVQPYREANVRSNLMSLFMFAIRLASETANCAVIAGVDVGDEFRDRFVSCRDECAKTMVEKVGKL
jgi:hypothetical protein